MVVDSENRPASFAARTAPEINDVAQRDGSVLVVPVGSVEQHGSHLPVGTDSILVREVAHRGAARVRDDVPLLVSPAVWTGNSPHHLPFGGTLSVEPNGLKRILGDVADSAVELGFDAVVLLNGHGGNKSLVGAAVSEIGRRHPSIEVVGCTYFDLAAAFVDDVRESGPGGTGHAGEFETSLMLALRPDLVDEDAAASGVWEAAYDHAGNDMFDGGPLSVYRTTDERTETGVSGDATCATVDAGLALLDGLDDELDRLFTQVHEQARD